MHKTHKHFSQFPEGGGGNGQVPLLVHACDRLCLSPVCEDGYAVSRVYRTVPWHIRMTFFIVVFHVGIICHQPLPMPPLWINLQTHWHEQTWQVICNIDFNFNSFYTVLCFSVCLRCGVTLAAFLCPVIAVEFETIIILAFTLYLVCARCSKGV